MCNVVKVDAVLCLFCCLFICAPARGKQRGTNGGGSCHTGRYIYFLVPVVCYNTYLTLPPAARGIVNRNHFNERVD